MSTPVRIALIVVLAGLLWYLVITLARDVSAQEPLIPEIDAEQALDEPVDPDTLVNLDADRTPDDPDADPVADSGADPAAELTGAARKQIDQADDALNDAMKGEVDASIRTAE